LLSQLFAQARTRLSQNIFPATPQQQSFDPGSQASHDPQVYGGSFQIGDLSTPRPPEDVVATCRQNPISAGVGQSPLSVINILYEENESLPDPRSSMPLTAAGRARNKPNPSLNQSLESSNKDYTYQKSRTEEEEASASSTQGVCETRSTDSLPKVTPPESSSNALECFVGIPMLLEKEYVNFYFQNLHYAQPFLSCEAFKSRCEREIWACSSTRRLRPNQLHFLALYNSVLAVGALTAGTDALQSFREELDSQRGEQQRDVARKAPSSIRLSKLYFQRARRLLGDVFEVSSLESSQTLLMMVFKYFPDNSGTCDSNYR
jgi:hypothetical protein